MLRRIVCSHLFAVLVFTLSMPSAWAADADADDLALYVVPYLWLVGIEGDTTVRGRDASVDVSFQDVLDHLDTGFMMNFEVWMLKRFGLLLNWVSADLGANAQRGPIGVDADANFFQLGFGIAYRLGPWHLGRSPESPTVIVEPYAGGRYTNLDVSFDLDVRDGASPRSINGGEAWLDPVIGLRTQWDVTKAWNLIVGGDIGGFGAGSEFTWQMLGLIGYRFRLFAKHHNANVVAGYRALYQDYETGSGRQMFKWDVTLHGPLLGLALRF